MTDPPFDDQDASGEAHLRALFKRDTSPPQRDPAFTHAAMRRIAGRRFWFNLLAAVPWLVAASAALWAFAPILEGLGRDVVHWWGQDALRWRALSHAAEVYTPAAGVLLGLAFVIAPRARRL